MSTLVLPRLRQELALHRGPRLLDGQPSWTLQDPVRNLFFRLDWVTFEILARWDLERAEEIVEAVRQETTLDPTDADVIAVADFLVSNELVVVAGARGVERLSRTAEARRSSFAAWLVHNYLFFRLPLLRPDALLQAALRPTRWLRSRGAAWISILAFVAGIGLVLRQWDVFVSSLADTMTPGGIALYAATLVFVKILHEFGHGIAARQHGCHVPTMGIAFMVLWPMPYTDVNEAWKLADRRARALIGAAGVLTELLVAVWATLAWTLLEDGALRTAAFLLATTTWVSTLVINLSPFMRFDGYFVLSDLLDMPNLHARSFALARWALREWLFALGEDPPEMVPRRRRAALVLFAWFTMCYRLVVFLGIAFLVYAFFIKLVGLALFAIEIWYFILRPVHAELRAWPALWPSIRRSPRALGSLLAATALVGIFVVPMPWTLRVTGLLRPGEEHAIHAPEGVRIESIHVRDGEIVSRGTPLFDLSSALLDERLVATRSRLQRISAQIDQAAVTPDLRARMLVLQAELQTAQAAMRAIEAEKDERHPVAPADGRVRMADPDIRNGTWVARKERLATVIDGSRWQVEAYAPEQDLRRIGEGARGLFHLEGGGESPIPVELVSINRDASRTLSSGYFAHLHGGSVLVREVEGRLVPEHAIFRLVLRPLEHRDTLANQTWRGRVVLNGEPESLAARAARAAVATLWREAGW